jgi:ribonucleoside-diphosphate reductase alpha chain
MDEWKALYDSKSGERGIFNRESAIRMASKNGRRNTEDYEFGTNPCSEIILRNREFCNLSEVVVRVSDTKETLLKKVRLASILGTFQSTLVNFKYVSSSWKKNCEEERLLGVSLTGIMDCSLTNGKARDLDKLLVTLKEEAVKTNAELAKKIGINQSVAVTCVKPSGTVSQLVNAASGIHARHNPYYIRTVRGDKKDPLTKMMRDAGFPVEDDSTNPSHTSVFSFPIKVEASAVFRTDISAIKQLELWKIYQEHWCEHKPSVTISVRENEWLDVGAWVYEHFDYMSGVSFLPFSEHTYKQAPYQDCEKEEYEVLLSKMPKNVEWSKLSDYEKTDMTIASQELACSAGFCEIQ